MRLPIAVLTLVFLATAPPVWADPSEDQRAQLDERIHASLMEMDPEAATLFRKADEARDRHDHAAAAELYGEVFAKVPTCVDALRRQAGEEDELGDHEKAMELAGRAVQLVRSSDNLAVFAMVVVKGGTKAGPTPDELKRAMGLAREAVIADRENLFASQIRAQIAMLAGDSYELDQAIDSLRHRLPTDRTTLFFQSVAAAWHGDLDSARSLLEQAHAAGFPDEVYTSVKGELEKAAYEQAHPLWKRIAWGAGLATVAWLGTGLLLFGTGIALSGVTLKQSERVPEDPNAGPTGSESRLRSLYRLLLAVCCVYYYLSLPILLALVLAAGGGLLYEMLTVGHIPIKLILLVFIATVVTVWSIVKSVFVRRRAVDPGERLDLESEPGLRDVLRRVAERVGTRPVDTVFLTPGTEIAVFERGGLMRQLAGKSERCLILGAGVLEGMRVAAFQAVLAHEYGHFSNRDTAGGGLALSVRRSVVVLATHLARGGAANWYNPAWLFVNGFHRVFLRISQGASRLQEVLADRWAALLFGAQAFEEGLRHVIDRSVRFDVHADATIREVVEAKRPLANLYRHTTSGAIDEATVERKIREAVEREASPYDSHPCPLDRFRWVHALGTPAPRVENGAEPAWSLFQHRDAIEERMTNVIRSAVRANHGISIAAS